MDGLLALQFVAFWTLYPAMPEETLTVNDMTRSSASIPKFNIEQSMCDPLDHVPSQLSATVHLRRQCLCRAPTLRHEIETHQVHLDWLIERVNSEHSVSSRKFGPAMHLKTL